MYAKKQMSRIISDSVHGLSEFVKHNAFNRSGKMNSEKMQVTNPNTFVWLATSVVAGAMIFSMDLVAAEYDEFSLYYPAAFCNHDGLQPNAAAGLGNWTGTTKHAYCPMLQGGWNNLKTPRVKKSGSVTCNLRILDSAGSWQWIYYPENTVHNSGYDTLFWASSIGLSSYINDRIPAFECDVSDGARIQSYGAISTFLDLR